MTDTSWENEKKEEEAKFQKALLLKRKELLVRAGLLLLTPFVVSLMVIVARLITRLFSFPPELSTVIIIVSIIVSLIAMIVLVGNFQLVNRDKYYYW